MWRFKVKTSLNLSRSLDWRSLIIGLLIAMMALLASGHKSGDRFTGRYEAFSAGNDPYGMFVFDSYTGQTWRMDNKSTLSYGTPEDREYPESLEPEDNR
jgi:hypothetical protein